MDVFITLKNRDFLNQSGAISYPKWPYTLNRKAMLEKLKIAIGCNGRVNNKIGAIKASSRLSKI
jgi:hypothetical protein